MKKMKRGEKQIKKRKSCEEEEYRLKRKKEDTQVIQKTLVYER